MRAHLDFETRSRADLKKCGAQVYAEHPSTEVLCLAWQIDDNETKLWSPFDLLGEHDELDELYDAVEAGVVLVAFNSGFERAVWEEIMVKRHGAPVVEPWQWECSAARVRLLALPRSLDGNSKVLDLETPKDGDGYRVMMRMCKPRKPTKHDKSEWHESKADFDKLFGYCKTDVKAEGELVSKTPAMSSWERRLWEVDQRINHRGFCVDVDTVKKIVAIIGELTTRATARVAEISKGEVTAPTQTQRIKDYVSKHWCETTDVQASTIEGMLEDPFSDMPDNVREVLEIRRMHGGAAVKKYQSLLNRTSADGRLRGGFIYSGAGRTRRWSGSGFQPQNIKKGFDDPELINIAIDCIQRGDIETLEFIFGDPMKLFSNIIRPMIVPKKDHHFLCADFSAIELVGLSVVSGDKAAIDDLIAGRQVYKTMAMAIYNVTYEGVTSEQRFFGKQARLGLGYGMGAVKFAATCANYGHPISLIFASAVVNKYREMTRASICQLWKQIEADAMYTLNSGRSIQREFYGFRKEPNALVMTLISGTERWYQGAKIKVVEKFGKLTPSIIYQTVGLGGSWTYTETWGGKLTENLIQALSRDLMGAALIDLEGAGYSVVLHAHDEALIEAPDGQGSLGEVCDIMCNAAPWASSWPLEAKGWKGDRYRK